MAPWVQRDLAPLLARLSTDRWTAEADIVPTLALAQLRIFLAVTFGLVERRRRLFRRSWKIRLVPPS